MPVNAHKAFVADAGKNFHDEIKVPDPVQERLRMARDAVRQAIVEASADWTTYVLKEELFVDTASAQNPRQPRFRMQGSFSYHTHVIPAHLPPQQIDMDDGMFLPVDLVMRDSRNQPHIASRGLFRLVDGVLEKLCRERGWKLDISKPSCARVIISDTEHTDLAIYAFPKGALDRAVETASMRDHLNYAHDGYLIEEAVYRDLDLSQIMLAHRTEGWIASNPRLLEDWFNNRVARHGAQLRRICRYLKAWRDFQPNLERLASIALMAIVVDAFEASPDAFDDSRDDLAMLSVAETLASKLANKIPNPVVANQWLDQNWTSDERERFCAAASQLYADLISGLVDAGSKEECVVAIRRALGDRFPNSTDSIIVEDFETKAASLSFISSLSEAEITSRSNAAVNSAGRSATKPYFQV